MKVIVEIFKADFFCSLRPYRLVCSDSNALFVCFYRQNNTFVASNSTWLQSNRCGYYYQSTGKSNTCKQILVISFSASQARAPDDVIYVVNKTYRNVQLYQLLYIFFCQENIVQSHDTLTCINHVAYLPSARYVSRQESAQVLMYQSCNREFPTALVSLAASLILVIDSISIRFFINTLLPSVY